MDIVKSIIVSIVLINKQCYCAPVEGHNTDYNAASDSLYTPSLDIYSLLNVQSLQIKFLSDRITELQGKPGTVYSREVYTTGGAYAELSQAEGPCNITMRDCLDLYQNGCHIDGVYLIDPALNGHTIRAYCDMTNEGWTVIQRRVDDSVNFFRNRNSYEEGFGNLNGNHWIGLQHMYDLTHSDNNEVSELYVYIEDFNSVTAFAKYANFSITDYRDNYRLHVSGYYGTAGDSLVYHNAQQFSTYDFDVDDYSSNCAMTHKGGWWYKGCHHGDINGVYLHGGVLEWSGITWYKLRNNHYSYKTAVMKIRRHSVQGIP